MIDTYFFNPAKVKTLQWLWAQSEDIRPEHAMFSMVVACRAAPVLVLATGKLQCSKRLFGFHHAFQLPNGRSVLHQVRTTMDIAQAQHPLWRLPFKKYHCAVLATAIVCDGIKMSLSDNSPFVLAAVYNGNQTAANPDDCFALVTVDGMPILLTPDQLTAWLAGDCNLPDNTASMLQLDTT